MVLDNYIEQEINGKTYKLCLCNKAIFQAERELTCGKLLVALADPPLSMGDLFTLFKWALIGGGEKVDEDQALELYLSLISEKGAIPVFNIILETLQKAEILGKTP